MASTNTFRSARSRAAPRNTGITPKSFGWGRPTDPARLKGILGAGIEGARSFHPYRLSPSPGNSTPPKYAAATFGYGLSFPALHRASTNMTQGIREATTRLTERGYRRIGLAVTPWVDQRSDHTYSAIHAALSAHDLSQKPGALDDFSPQRSPRSGKKPFCDWMKKYRPDAVISFHTLVPGMAPARSWPTRPRRRGPAGPRLAAIHDGFRGHLPTVRKSPLPPSI